MAPRKRKRKSPPSVLNAWGAMSEIEKAARWRNAWQAVWQRWRTAVEGLPQTHPRIVLRALRLRAKARAHYVEAERRVIASNTSNGGTP